MDRALHRQLLPSGSAAGCNTRATLHCGITHHLPPGGLMPARSNYAPDPSKGVLLVDWPLFGELSRALALKVARAYHPELIVGIATAGVVPGAAVAAIL